MRKLITNCKIFTGETVLTGQNLLIEEGRIVSLTMETPANVDIIDLKGKNLGPGFIDIQINGGYERYFSHMPNPETLTDIYQACRHYATPYFLVTLISSPHHTILQAIKAIREFMKRHPGVLGMHLEGPFINPGKKGAHSAGIIRKPTDSELKEITAKGKDVIKLITIAPECFTEEQLGWLLDSGILVSAGHSLMTYEQAQYYFSKGINLVTHLYNAMTQFGHRDCGTVGAVFDNPQVHASIVLDGGHCHYAAARIAYKQKGDKLFLIPDASFLGRKKTVFDWEGLNIEMVDGYYRDKAGNLAGAAISMPEAIKNAVEHLAVSLQDAIEMATSRVAKAIKLDHQIGYIRQGYPAVFSVFDDALQMVELLEC